MSTASPTHAAPRAVVATGQAESEAAIVAELNAAAPDVTLEGLAPGVWRAASATDLVARFREHPPLFIRHVCPATLEVALEGTEADPARIAGAAAALWGALAPDLPLSVQTRLLASELPYRPFAVNDAVVATAPAAIPRDVRRPRQIASVVVARRPRGGLVALVGLSRAEDNLSDWAGGAHRLAREDDQVSRAEGKLVEALAVFGLEPPRGGTAVDLGAAPGGWTRVLRQRGLSVTAVDPGALDPRVARDPQVTWLPTTAERWLATSPAPVDVCVADMRMDARDAARLMREVAPFVRGFAVLTLKLPEREPARVAAEALRLLVEPARPGGRPGWRIAQARQLFHNRSEVTVALVPAR